MTVMERIVKNINTVADRYGVCIQINPDMTFFEIEEEVDYAFTTYGVEDVGSEIKNTLIRASLLA